MSKWFGSKNGGISTRWAKKSEDNCHKKSKCEPCAPKCEPCLPICAPKCEPKCELDCCQVTTCDNVFPHDIYVIGSSYEDTGNWYHYYGQSGDFVFGPNQPILPARTTSLTTLFGPEKRFSNGLNHVDYVMNDLGMVLYNDYLVHCLSDLPCDKKHIVNLGVCGATVNGNAFNGPTNADFNAIVGDHGYDSQVTRLTNLLGCGKFCHDDVVMYLLVGAVDIGAMLSLSPSDLSTAVTTFVNTHVQNIQSLYDKGCRRMIFSYMDSDTIPRTVAYQKLNFTTPGVIGAAQSIAMSLFDGPSGLISAIENLLVTTCMELDINIIPTSTLLIEYMNNPTLYGLRTVRANDIDPRGPPAAAPFPTYYDMESARGVTIKNTFFYDDYDLTEIMHRNLADIYANYLRRYSHVSKNSQQCYKCSN